MVHIGHNFIFMINDFIRILNWILVHIGATLKIGPFCFGSWSISKRMKSVIIECVANHNWMKHALYVILKETILLKKSLSFHCFCLKLRLLFNKVFYSIYPTSLDELLYCVFGFFILKFDVWSLKIKDWRNMKCFWNKTVKMGTRTIFFCWSKCLM